MKIKNISKYLDFKKKKKNMAFYMRKPAEMCLEYTGENLVLLRV